MEGVLASFPALGADPDVRRIAFPRPRGDVTALIGEASQSLPVLIPADDAPAGLAAASHQGRGFVKAPMVILDAHRRRRGLPPPHP